MLMKMQGKNTDSILLKELENKRLWKIKSSKKILQLGILRSKGRERNM
jgi:hypothetical protein